MNPLFLTTIFSVDVRKVIPHVSRFFISKRNFCFVPFVAFNYASPKDMTLYREYESYCKSIIPANHTIKENFMVYAMDPAIHNGSFLPSNLLDEHCDRTIVVLEGSGTLTIENNTYDLSIDKLIRINRLNAGKTHTLAAKSSVKCAVIVHDETTISPWKLIIQ